MFFIRSSENISVTREDTAWKTNERSSPLSSISSVTWPCTFLYYLNLNLGHSLQKGFTVSFSVILFYLIVGWFVQKMMVTCAHTNQSPTFFWMLMLQWAEWEVMSGGWQEGLLGKQRPVPAVTFYVWLLLLPGMFIQLVAVPGSRKETCHCREVHPMG